MKSWEKQPLECNNKTPIQPIQEKFLINHGLFKLTFFSEQYNDMLNTIKDMTNIVDYDVSSQIISYVYLKTYHNKYWKLFLKFGKKYNAHELGVCVFNNNNNFPVLKKYGDGIVYTIKELIYGNFYLTDKTECQIGG